MIWKGAVMDPGFLLFGFMGLGYWKNLTEDSERRSAWAVSGLTEFGYFGWICVIVFPDKLIT